LRVGIVLIVVGVVLLGFGAFVLLRFPDRPGGNLTFRGITVSSKGAGLPIIVLGLAAVVVAVITAAPDPRAGPGPADTVNGQPNPRPSSDPSSAASPPATPADPVDAALASSPCLGPLLEDYPTVPRDDVRQLPIDRTETVRSQPEALLLTERGALLAVVRLEFDKGPTDVYHRKVLVSDLVDQACKPVKHTYYDAARTSEDAYGRSVLTWQLAGRSYQIDFDHTNSSADATLRTARKPPVTAAELGACLNAYLAESRKVTFREELPAGRKFGMTVAPTALLLYRENALLGMARVEKEAFSSTLSVFELVDATCKPVRHNLSDRGGTAVATFSVAGGRYRLRFDHHAGGSQVLLTALSS
jgi:hypothetical protein